MGHPPRKSGASKVGHPSARQLQLKSKSKSALDPDGVLQGCGDGGDMFVHEGFAFGFDHDAGEFLGAGIAHDDATIAV